MSLSLRHKTIYKNTTKLLIGVVCLFFILCGNIMSESIYLNLSSKNNRRIFILVEKINLTKTIDDDFSDDLTEVIKNDLRLSGYFKVEERLGDFKSKKEYDIWVKKTEDLLFKAEMKDKFSKKIKGVLLDVKTGKKILDKTWEIKNNNTRKTMHTISDDIIEYVTGIRGINDTEILFVSDATGYKEIWKVDYDGANLERITNNRSISILPRWYPSDNKFVYTTYMEGNPDLFSFDIDTRKNKMLSGRQGLNSAGSFSPNSKYLALTINIKGDPEVCLLKKNGKFIKRLTNVKGVDTSPTWSPDSTQLAYISERTGVTQLRLLDLDDNRAHTLTYNNKFKDSPHFSPRGDKIVYAELNSKWDIFLLDINTKKTLQLTKGSGHNESPCFSNDGSKICFVSNRFEKKELFIMNADGSNQRKLVDIKGNVYSPRWSQ